MKELQEITIMLTGIFLLGGVGFLIGQHVAEKREQRKIMAYFRNRPMSLVEELVNDFKINWENKYRNGNGND